MKYNDKLNDARIQNDGCSHAVTVIHRNDGPTLTS